MVIMLFKKRTANFVDYTKSFLSFTKNRLPCIQPYLLLIVKVNFDSTNVSSQKQLLTHC